MVMKILHVKVCGMLLDYRKIDCHVCIIRKVERAEINKIITHITIFENEQKNLKSEAKEISINSRID